MEKSKIKNALFLCILILFCRNIYGQGDGARMLLWGPKGVTTFIPKWMHLEENILPGDILVKEANVTIDVFPLVLVHNFDLAGHFAQVMVMANPGSITGTLTASNSGFPSPELSNSGLADGFVGFKFGLINEPGLNAIEFAKYKQKFSMMGYFRLWYPGSYDHKNPLNLGTNRFTFEFGPAMNFHFGENPKRATILEVYPAVRLYTSNNNPTLITLADKTQQEPLYTIENHLTHNFTDKFWAGVDLRYQYGGALKADGVKQDNKQNTLGSGIVAGYQVLSMLSINADYGGRIAGSDGAKINMFKLTATISYLNKKKLQIPENN
jgi:hypothetical protein